MKISLSHSQRLLIRGHYALRTHNFNRCQGANLHLLLIVGERLFRQGQRFLLHLHVLVGVDQVPVNVLDLIHRGDHLQTKGDIGDLAVVLGDANESGGRQQAEALQ